MALDPLANGNWYKRYSAGNKSLLEDIPNPTPSVPEHLYGWSEQNVATKQLYAWTHSTIGTIYTITSTPSVGDHYYKANGGVYSQYELTGDDLAFLPTITAVGEGTISLSGDPT